MPVGELVKERDVVRDVGRGRGTSVLPGDFKNSSLLEKDTKDAAMDSLDEMELRLSANIRYLHLFENSSEKASINIILRYKYFQVL